MTTSLYRLQLRVVQLRVVRAATSRGNQQVVVSPCGARALAGMLARYVSARVGCALVGYAWDARSLGARVADKGERARTRPLL